MRKPMSFHGIAEDIRQAEALREGAIARGFAELERHDATLVRLLLENIGDRQRAARWMCMRQRAFDGRTAYDLLAEGDVDTVWDRVTGERELPAPALQVRAAY